MMKILFMIDSLGGGGAENVLLTLLTKMDRKKFSITLFLLAKVGVYLPKVPKDVTIRYLFCEASPDSNCVNRFFLKLVLYLGNRFLSKFPLFINKLVTFPVKYDCAISFCEGLNSFLLLKKDLAYSRIAWIHIDIAKHNLSFPKEKLKCVLVEVERIAVVSNDAKSSLVTVFEELNLGSKTTVIYNPIDVDVIIANSDNLIPFKKERFTLVAVGRLSKQKRFDRLIMAFDKLCKSGYDCDLLILGIGPEFDHLTKLVASIDYGERVTFCGYIQNSYPWIKMADLLVMSSDFEGLPLVICEAMVLHKPIVATNIVGTRELLEDGKYGLLVSPDEVGLYEGMKIMIDEPWRMRHYVSLLENSNYDFIFSIDTEEIESYILNA